MPNYNIEYVYNEPYSAIINDFPAKDVADAKELALEEIETLFPEASDIEIIRVTEVV